MGSGIRRKKSDAPVIRVPKKFDLGDMGIPKNHVGAAACIASFETKVDASYLTRHGVKVRLQRKGEVFIILIGEDQIGIISKKHSQMILHCATLGITYSGEIIVDKKGVYARFFRVP
jgi:hypothetical protein